MAVSDVSIGQDGAQGNVKIHPYLITFVRWCVSCLWSTATVFLHRLITSPLPPIAASKQSTKQPAKRQAGTDHLHPEPKVECVVLHEPHTPTLDVIFVHGLYGSLGNTWRQGEWRSKYKSEPTKVPLRNHAGTPCKCTPKPDQTVYNNIQEEYNYETNLNINETNINEKVTFNQFNGCLKKILPNENSLITEKFYNNMIRVEVNNYEQQAKFVSELFKNNCDSNCDLNTFKCSVDKQNVNQLKDVNFKCNLNETSAVSECSCKLNEVGRKCEVGCGCVCDDCYSPCWPKDWIKEDFPGARVISINYTSDPYLWRPLWVKGNKRLRLHERAEQMTEQLLAMGVGQRPIVWVGHSKGGLFIKQIYCEAYEAHLKVEKNIKNEQNTLNNNTDQSHRLDNVNIDNNKRDNNTYINFNNKSNSNNSFMNNNFNDYGTPMRSVDEMNKIRNNTNSGNNNSIVEGDNLNIGDKLTGMCECDGDDDGTAVDDKASVNMMRDSAADTEISRGDEVLSSSNEEDSTQYKSRASLWRQSAGFMFYSVPHRGSPLALIKTPITSRSVELLEIAKDSPLVLELQSRWERATVGARPAVRSLVETGRTLMSVLWLRIVSVHSADAGVGSLHGVSVDHREICKPSSRRCLLYTELTELIRAALNKCQCQ